MSKEFAIKEIARVEFTPEKLEEMDQKQRIQILDRASNELFKFKSERPEEWNASLQHAHDLIKEQIKLKGLKRGVE